MIPKFEKSFLLDSTACRVKYIEIIHCTLINIHAVWIFFGFQPIIWKLNLKKLSISLLNLSIRIHWYITHCNLINIYALLLVWTLFCFQPKFRKLIRNLKKKLLISLRSSLRQIYWYITHCNAIWSITTPRYSIKYFLGLGKKFKNEFKISKKILPFVRWGL